jgi:hypothetical protein
LSCPAGIKEEAFDASGHPDGVNMTEATFTEPLDLESLQGMQARAGAYLAMCLAVKDQTEDLREWLEYHRGIGAAKFYIFDDNSMVSPLTQIKDLIDSGIAA